jgi:hypothetical protein
MTIELTKTQLQTLDAEGDRVRVVDPRTNTGYVLVPAADFESVREILEDERQQRAIRQIGLRNAAARAGDET